MKYIILFLILFSNIITHAQIVGLTPELIKKYNIKKAKVILDMKSDTPTKAEYKNLEVKTCDFDSKGRYIRLYHDSFCSEN